MKIEISQRLKNLPPYLFAEIDRMKKEAIVNGRDIIDLGVGDPDMPTPIHIIESLYESAQNPANHRYALNYGMPLLRNEMASWYKKRFQVKLNPDTEILPLIGSKEGIAHIPLAFINPGDEAIIPDPCYPPYISGTIFAGGVCHIVPMLESNGFFPDLDKIDCQVAKRAKLIFLNYPNNPTAAIANEEFFKKVVDFATENNIIVCHDAAYSEIYFDGCKPLSFLQIDGAKEIGVEFHSLSKTYNMTGWRIGFAIGSSEIIKALAAVKSNIDSGIFQAVQFAGIVAMKTDKSHINSLSQMYKSRRDVLADGLNALGWKVPKPKATFYVWMPVPPGSTSTEFSKMLLEKCDIVTTPGIGFGRNGEGYIRMALTVSEDRLKEAVGRIKKLHEK
ncbi:MAG: LL-diaminopimelate aminotransferase [Candidatus Omnitrophota bacterium]|nr:MAG: LL-diaminopimelate aminotransferase [Candidatus Omnitrophota bacterium]